MRLIPVIDLLQGRAVRAVRGERAAYRPVSCALARGGDPLRLAAAYVETFAADTVYIADLDAITGRGDNIAVISAIGRLLAPATLWVDAGLGDLETLRQFRDRDLGRPVIGSETLADPAVLDATEVGDAVLSLDYRHGGLVGPAGLAAQPRLWPAEVIVMSLARVGTGSGPDTEQLARCRNRSPTTRLYAAGGVRDAGDLRSLEAAGAAGVLVASALQDGRITMAQLAARS